MTSTNIPVPSDILLQVRKLLPKNPMNYNQARIVAEMQAGCLRKTLRLSQPTLPLDWIEQIPGVSVMLVTASDMERRTKTPASSGATAIGEDGSYRIYIAENNSRTHCRFTLCHELFHVITGPFESEIFSDFGHGDSELHKRRIERVADHFAANLLVPKGLLCKAWDLPVRGLAELAGIFGVSEDAMRIRLRTVGLIRSGLTKEMFYRTPAYGRYELEIALKGGER
ncbi:ImmA/IrrE family metallo-endopeptidase [Plantactinospora solaniradicis]|uniref:ImmA/IrrE family metallo-endopeptidase n=1 Tax=Plantactinospora solaniradicis TaxID=1723736 RepID=A0ABW1KLL7_9ACTN